MSPDAKYPWSVLGLEKMPPEVKDIRRAYARALKQIDQGNDIKGFSALRAAYENAVAIREGRDTQNDYNRTRKAAAKAAQAEAPAEQPEDAQAEVSPPPSVGRAPSPDKLVTQARRDAAEALLAALATDRIRYAIAEVSRTRFKRGE